MKLFAIALLGLLATGCTTVATQDQLSQLTYIDEHPGKEKGELFDKSNEWVARTFNSANDVIQLSNPSTGQIIGRGITFTDGSGVDLGFKRPFKYTMVIDIKAEKMRVGFENLEPTTLNGVGGPDIGMQFASVKRSLDSVANQLREFVSTTEADW